MTISSIHSSSPILPSASMDSSLSTQPETLLVGELTIGGRCYTVSIESSESLVSTPPPTTQEKIQYLADLYLTHLESQGADLSKIVLQQIDEEGLSYVSLLGNDEMKEETLPSSNIKFPRKEEGVLIPPSLQTVKISTIKQIYDLIMEPLIAKNGESTREEIPRISLNESKNKISTTKKSNPRIIFTPNRQETVVKNIDDSTPNRTLRNPENKDSSREISKKIEDSSTEIENEIENSQESKSNNIFTRLKEKVANLIFREKDSYDVVDSDKIVEEEKEKFLQANLEVQEESEA